MKTQKQNGFTIIEVMLFLAITGALAVGILAGSAAVISQQRYRDSVNSLKGLIQEQYGQASNVISEGEKPLCSRSGDEVTFDESIQRSRGTSDCLIMGRFILLEPTQVTTYNLIGQPSNPRAAPGGDDVTALGDYSLSISSPEPYAVSWSARIVQPGTTNGMTTSILIVRSPISGAMLTYVQDGDHKGSVKGMVATGNMVQKDFCLDSGGMSDIGGRMAVRINARASGQSAVEVPPESKNVCD